MTQEEMGELLLEIKGDLKLINMKLEQDYNTIHGNGKPGLVGAVQDLKIRITKMETETETTLKWIKICGWAISTLIAVASVLIAFRGR